MKRRTTVISLLLLLSAALAVFFILYCQEKFIGSRVADPNTYALDIESMNGTDQHSLELNAGDSLEIKFETVSGSLYPEITTSDGAEHLKRLGIRFIHIFRLQLLLFFRYDVESMSTQNDSEE